MSGDVLVVDDTPNNIAVLVGILRASGYQARVANSGQGALSTIRARAPELILLDINMPDLDGYEVCRELKRDPATAEIPVLFISALDDALDKVKAFQAGGVDYIPKPFQAEEVLARIESHLKIGRLQRELQAQAAQLRMALETLAEVSVTDPLTGLRNRRFLLSRIGNEVNRTLERHQAGETRARLGFLLVDIDHFKNVNDRHGHAAGDAVLANIGKRLRAAVGDADLVVRWGGEEFLIVTHLDDEENAATLAEGIRKALSDEPTDLADGVRLGITISVGFACYPFFCASPASFGWEDLVNVADAALYAAKHAGRDCWVGLSEPANGPSKDALRELKASPRRGAARGDLAMTSSVDVARVLDSLRSEPPRTAT